VLKTAEQLLAERGLAGLTMRGLASRLGVAPNALYSHVSSKTALIDDLLDEVLGLVDTPDPEVEPGTGLESIMRSSFSALLEHPDLVPSFLARQGARGPNAHRLGEVMFAFLARAGITGTRAEEARRVLIVYTIGFAALATSSALEQDAAGPVPEDELTRNFASGLTWLLTGIISGAGRPPSV
jgi:TetR/AcrR family transcriptional regulator, tetracycline repressor protein